MKVFICWSGTLSEKLGECLRGWIPSVVQSIDPYFTPSDVDKGSRWLSEISNELSESKVGLLCLTPENINSDWLMFEAGALSKQLEKTRVCPVLFGIKPTDLAGPLKQFQATRFEKDDFKQLVGVMNECLEDRKLATKTLDSAFSKWWPDLEDNVHQILSTVPATDKPIRPDRELLEEVLATTRRLRLTSSRPVSARAVSDLLGKFIALHNQQANGEGGYQDALDLMHQMREPIHYLVRLTEHSGGVSEMFNTVKGLRFRVVDQDDEAQSIDGESED